MIKTAIYLLYWGNFPIFMKSSINEVEFDEFEVKFSFKIASQNLLFISGTTKHTTIGAQLQKLVLTSDENQENLDNS